MNSELPAWASRWRANAALGIARAATAASRKTGLGSGGMIGGLIAGALDPHIMSTVGTDRSVVLVTGTNGKSTTTRMVTAALRTHHTVVSNEGGDNMDAGIISALMSDRSASHAVLECDELHVPHVADALSPKALVLLNLSRDQLDRVGEINKIEQALRACVNKHPEMLVIANCDDVLITSVAYDSPNVVWVSAGAGWFGEGISSPRTEDAIIHRDGDWFATTPLPDGREFRRPTPSWTITPEGIVQAEGSVDGSIVPLNLSVPGNANRGNATQAIAAAVEGFDIPLEDAVRAAEGVDNVAGRYSTVTLGDHQLHLLLAKNPAGWQESLSMVDLTADGLVIAVNGQVADGEDLSWLWDVRFEDFGDLSVKASGERGADLDVRLLYAGIDHELIKDPLKAIQACPPGRIEVLANYTAFRDLKRQLDALTSGTPAQPEPTGLLSRAKSIVTSFIRTKIDA